MPRIGFLPSKGNWASDFKCLILFNTAGESVIISGAGCPKMGTPARQRPSLIVTCTLILYRRS